MAPAIFIPLIFQNPSPLRSEHSLPTRVLAHCSHSCRPWSYHPFAPRFLARHTVTAAPHTLHTYAQDWLAAHPVAPCAVPGYPVTATLVRSCSVTVRPLAKKKKK